MKPLWAVSFLGDSGFIGEILRSSQGCIIFIPLHIENLTECILTDGTEIFVIFSTADSSAELR